MAECSAGKCDKWQGNMTVLVVNRGMITPISILNVVFQPMMELDDD